MAAKNERKLEVLKFVDQEGEVTPDQVADIFDMEIEKGSKELVGREQSNVFCKNEKQILLFFPLSYLVLTTTYRFFKRAKKRKQN